MFYNVLEYDYVRQKAKLIIGTKTHLVPKYSL